MRVIVAFAALATVMILPASAEAVELDLAIRQEPSATIVKAGETVTLRVPVSNLGTRGYDQVYVSLDSLRSHGKGANNPFVSFSTSQGTCKDTSGAAYGNFYNVVVCELGALASGASAQITAVVRVNETAVHTAALLPNPVEGGFNDYNNVNNEASNKLTASTPPKLSGSKKLKFRGLPSGCASSDFTLRVSTKARGVKKLAAKLFLGFDEEGEGREWRKVVRGNRLVARVPVSQIVPEALETVYKLKVKAKRGALGPLQATVAFQLC
jgi:hypothetical protein